MITKLFMVGVAMASRHTAKTAWKYALILVWSIEAVVLPISLLRDLILLVTVL